MKMMMAVKLALAFLSFAVVLLVSASSLAQIENLDDRQKGYSDLKNSGKLFSMVIEPSGNQLKIFLAGKKTAGLKMENATVEASYYVNGQKKSLIVKRQTDPKNKKPYYLIDRFEPSMTDLKINVKAGDKTETFDLPDLK